MFGHELVYFKLRKVLLFLSLVSLFLMVTNCSLADTLVIPEDVKTIQEEAFYGNTSLDEVVLPEGIEVIGSKAFAGSSVARINLPSSLQSIGAQVFGGVENLTILVKNGSYACNWAAAAEGASFHIIMVPESAYRYGTCGPSLSWTLDTEGQLIISGTGDMDDFGQPGTSPWNAETDVINGVLIGNGVTSIGNGAFRGCESLSSLSLPDSLASIGDHALENCSGLTDVVIPDGVTSIGSAAFGNCSGLATLSIPGSVTDIAPDALEGCENVTVSTVAGSTANQFCENNGIRHEQASALPGQYIYGDMMTYNGHAYQFVSNVMTWNNARDWCITRGGHLLTVNSEGEQNAITSWLMPNFEFARIWLGLHRSDFNTWITGEPVIYSNWGRYQPDNSWSSPQNCVAIANYTQSNLLWPGAWDDWSLEDQYEECFVCEWDAHMLKWDDDTTGNRRRLVNSVQSVLLPCIRTNSEWSAEAPDWITLRPTNGDPNGQDSYYTIEATVQENQAPEERTGQIVISAVGCKSLVLEVEQAPNVPPELVVESKTWNLGYHESVSLTVQAKKGKHVWVCNNVVFSSSDESIASVSRSGRITAKGKEGSVQITVSTVFDDIPLSKSYTLWVWGNGNNKGFSWISLKDKLNQADEKMLPKWNLAWGKIEEINSSNTQQLQNNINNEFLISFPMGQDDVKTAFIKELVQEFKDFDYDLIHFNLFSSTESIVKQMLEKLIDAEDRSFSFNVGNNTYYAQMVTGVPSEGAAWYTYKITAPDGSSYNCPVIIKSADKIKESMDSMKNLFIREYNNLVDTLHSGTLDMLGVDKVKDYVLDWIKGKGVDYLNANGKQWMENFGDRVNDLDTLKDNIEGMEPVDFTKELPQNIVRKIASYQNNIIKFIQDVLDLGTI